MANLSHSLILRHLEDLKQAGLVRQIDRVFEITAIGVDFLRSYEALEEMIEAKSSEERFKGT